MAVRNGRQPPMIVVPDVRNLESRTADLLLTIGSFDGVHLGHRRVLEDLTTQACALGVQAALLTLDPHPRQYFAPEHAPNLLTGFEKKRELLAGAGVEVLYVLPFDADTANMDREDFLREIVVERCGAKKLVVGHDFAFGKDAAGNYEYLEVAGPPLGIEVSQAPVLFIQGERVSSTLIREYVLQGDLTRAEQFLGRKYSLSGRVQRGRRIGATLGFPTANVSPANFAVPMHGIYAAIVRVEGKKYLSAVNVGIAPTIRHSSVVVEAHLLDFEGDLEAKEIEIEFHKRLRPEKRFPSREALVEAIRADVDEVRRYFQYT